MSARIQVRKEQNITLIKTSDPDLVVRLCHVQTLKLGSRSKAGGEIAAFSTQVNTMMIASRAVLSVTPTNSPPSTWVAQPDKGDLGPVFLEMNASCHKSPTALH
ncbi:hypothetical protein MRX96_046678 [Rhipicephalus microplus]